MTKALIFRRIDQQYDKISEEDYNKTQPPWHRRRSDRQMALRRRED